LCGCLPLQVLPQHVLLAGYVTILLAARPPSSTQSGTSPWFLDSRASFHMSM
jgi:hypothetical protein